MAFDRLSVLSIRVHHTEVAAASTSVDTAAFAGRLAGVRRQLAGLCAAIDTLVEDLRVGRRSVVFYEQLKLYAVDSSGGPTPAGGAGDQSSVEPGESGLDTHRR
jgi:hypothetical protein